MNGRFYLDKGPLLIIDPETVMFAAISPFGNGDTKIEKVFCALFDFGTFLRKHGIHDMGPDNRKQ